MGPCDPEAKASPPPPEEGRVKSGVQGGLHLCALAAALLFGVLGWATLGPGRVWAFDRFAQAGSAMLPEARIWAALPNGGLAVAAGVSLALACLARWRLNRRFPGRLGAVLFLLGGGVLLAESLKELLPRLLGAMGFPFSFAIGFPSGHATMALALALGPLFLAPPRWRSWAAALGGGVAATLNYSLLRGGFHPPGDILGAVLLTLCLAFLLQGFLPSRLHAPAPLEALPAFLVGGFGLGWLLSGSLQFWAVPFAEPGRMQVLAAFDAGWRLVVGAGLLAPGLVALRPWGGRGRFLVFALLPVLLFVGADFSWQRSRIQGRAHRPETWMEDARLRLAWLRQADKETVLIGNTVKWVQKGRGLRWEFAAQLPRRVQAVDQALQAFGSGPMDEAERQALVRVGEDWALFRSGLGALEGRIRAGEERPDIAELLRDQARLEASLESLIRRVNP